MKTIHLLIAIITIFTQFGYSQQDIKNICDKILFIDGTEIQAIVKEVNSTEIKYKKCEFQDGPIYSIESSKVFIIKFKNGRKQIVNTAENAKEKRKNNRKVFFNLGGEFIYGNFETLNLNAYGGFIGLNYRHNKKIEIDWNLGMASEIKFTETRYKYNGAFSINIYNNLLYTTNLGIRYNIFKYHNENTIYLKPNIQVGTTLKYYYPYYEIFIGSRMMKNIDISIGYSLRNRAYYKYNYYQNNKSVFDNSSKIQFHSHCLSTRLILNF
jgi:hypothetical protein